MSKPSNDKYVLKQTPLTDEEIDRLENYPNAERIDLATLLAESRRQAEAAKNGSAAKATPA